MKILKVKIKREQTGGGTHYVYPSEYDAEKITVLRYESTEKEADVIARGNTDEYLIGCVSDVDASQFLASGDIVELTKIDAIILGDTWVTKMETITNRDRVIQVLAKYTRGEKLTQQDKDILDPNHSETGIGKTRSFTEMLNNVKR